MRNDELSVTDLVRLVTLTADKITAKPSSGFLFRPPPPEP